MVVLQFLVTCQVHQRLSFQVRLKILWNPEGFIHPGGQNEIAQGNGTWEKTSRWIPGFGWFGKAAVECLENVCSYNHNWCQKDLARWMWNKTCHLLMYISKSRQANWFTNHGQHDYIYSLSRLFQGPRDGLVLPRTWECSGWTEAVQSALVASMYSKCFAIILPWRNLMRSRGQSIQGIYWSFIQSRINHCNNR